MSDSDKGATLETTSVADLNTQPIRIPRGIGGWLILPLLHLIVIVLLTAYNIGAALRYWDGLVLLATGRADPSVQWMALPTFASLLIGVAVIAFAIYVLVRFFQKKRSVPQLMIWFYVLVLVTALFVSGVIFAYDEFRSAPSDVGQAARDIGRALLAVAIWVPYFLTSKRVQATFVE